jgi:DNA-binding NarL/FixJ family response regulator
MGNHGQPIMARRNSLDLKRETTVTALVVDDDRSFHDLVRRVLGDAVRIVGATDSGAEAVWLAGAVRPQVVLMDVGMPEIEGVAAARLVKAAAPRTKVIVLTGHGEEAYLSATGKSGADAFLPKRLVRTELLSTIRALAGVSAGRRWMGERRRRQARPGEAPSWDGTERRRGHGPDRA